MPEITIGLEPGVRETSKPSTKAGADHDIVIEIDESAKRPDDAPMRREIRKDPTSKGPDLAMRKTTRE